MPNYEITSPTGQKYNVTAPEGASQEDILSYVKQQTAPSGMEAVARGAEANFPLANQAVAALEKGDYSTNLQQQIAAEKAAKEAQPGQYGVGVIGGTMAPLAIPGVGEALEGSPIVGNALLGAAQGVSDTDLVKQPQQALKNAAIGAGLGGATGALIPSGKSAAEGLENVANAKTVESMGMRPGTLGVKGEDIQDIGSFAHNLGLDEGSLEDKAFNAKEMLNQTGKQIEDLGQGKVLKDVTPYQQALSQHMNESAQVLGFDNNPEVRMYQKAMDNLRPGMTWDQLQTLKENYANRAFDANHNIKPNGEVAANIYSQIADAQQSLVSNSPEYPQLKQAYSQLKDMHEGLEGQLQKNQAAGTLPGKPIGMVGKIGSMVTGGNVPATVGASAALLPTHPYLGVMGMASLAGNANAMAGLARTGAKAIPTAMEAVRAGSIDAMTSHFLSNPQAYGKYAAPLHQAIQQGGSQGFAATSFVLRQQHPELNDIMMQTGKKPEDEDNANQ